MNKEEYNIGTTTDDYAMYQIGIAYVVIPSDVERSKYIAQCFKTSTVSIYSEHNGFSNRVPVDKATLNFIVFPENINQFGSAVSFKCDSIHNTPIIDGIYFKADELCDLQENQFKFKRELNGNTIEIVGSPSNERKYLGLNVNADEGGEILINVKSKDSSGKVNINVDGECNINSLTNTTLQQKGKLSLVTVNKEDDTEFTLVEQTSVGRKTYSNTETLHTSKLNINDGTQNFVLGQALKQFLKNVITEISNATVTTALGQMPLINKAQIVDYASDDNLNAFLSTIAFIDK